MHPLYLVDYIERIKRDLKNDVSYLRGGVDGIRAIETTVHDKELQWFIQAIEIEAALLDKCLSQLSVSLENLTKKEFNAS